MSENEGLFTTIWGPAMWESLHNISFNYPHNPTQEDKDNYYKFFISIGNILPCCTCRNSYKKHICEDGTKCTYDCFQNRETLTKWLFNFHHMVNKKLGYNYDITYDMLCKKHESYIASCNLTPEQKKNAYKNYYNRHAPIFKYDYLINFINYAKERGINDFETDIKYYNLLDRESEEWIIRNAKCYEQIKFMRLNGINALETEGKYNGLPTIDELKLMKYNCTNLTERRIQKILKKLGYNIINTYILKK